MKVASSIAELADLRDALDAPSPRPTVAFVPTMGALHDGHVSLIDLARSLADTVIVSIFVNPLQFGPGEDYARYPRPLEDDLEACRRHGVDVVLVPTVADLYPAGRQVSVNAGQLGTVFEGAARPGHLDGMLTVMLKLLNIVRPDIAILGQKDAQQLACIRRMVADLNVVVDVVAAPIVREFDGLALSSRNRYLTPPERTSALALSAAVRAAREQDTPEKAYLAAYDVVERAQSDPLFALGYLALVQPHTFVEVTDDHVGPALLVVAATVGTTRLIDNLELTFKGPELDD